MEINSTMSRYLREGRFQVHPDAVFYIERTLDGGKVRRGLVGRIDLEQYDYEPAPPPPSGPPRGRCSPASHPGYGYGRTPRCAAHVMLLTRRPGPLPVH